nr:HipA N-terminal domain-containing protein [Pseudenhygromyxa sp. WMMC2535]
MSARVLLGNVVVGELRPDAASGQTALEFDATYAASASRPVLGRWFEDQLIDPPRTFRGSPLPNYFRNLLPPPAGGQVRVGGLRTRVEPLRERGQRHLCAVW